LECSYSNGGFFRWQCHGILPSKIIIALVKALAKLNNFCIGEFDDNAKGGRNGGGGGGDQHSKEVPPLLNRDTHFITNNSHGHVRLGVDNIHQSTAVPMDLIHSGEKFTDVPKIFLRVHQKNMSMWIYHGHGYLI
jgi:hypothetical protein